MPVTLHSFLRPKGGWSNEERAQFLRIERLLADAGFAVEVEHGVTDEGDPWCVFCSRLTGDVMIHAARIGRRYVFDSTALGTPIEGVSFENCAERFFENAALPMPNPRGRGLQLHPSAMLASLFLTVLLYAQATSEQALLDLEGGASGDPETLLALRLKQIAAQVAEFFAATDAQAQATAAGGQGWTHAVPAGMAAAVIAIAHDLRLAEVFAADTDLTRAVLPSPQGPEEIAAATVEVEARAVAGRAEGSAAETELAATEPAEDAAHAVTLPESAAVAGETAPSMAVTAPGAGEAEAQAQRGADPGVSVPDDVAADFMAFASESDAGVSQIAAATDDAGGASAAMTTAYQIFDGVLAGFGDGSAASVTVSLDGAPAGAASAGGGEGAAAVGAADSYVVVIDPVDVTTATPVGEPVLQPEPAVGTPAGAGGIPTIAGASFLDVASLVIEFITAAGDVEITSEDGDLLIVDEDVLANPTASDVASARFVFEDDSAITLVGFDGDVDLLLA